MLKDEKCWRWKYQDRNTLDEGVLTFVRCFFYKVMFVISTTWISGYTSKINKFEKLML